MQTLEGGASLLLSPATKLRQSNVFTPVCDSVHRGGLGLCLGGLPSGVSVQGVSVRGSLFLGSLSRGCLCPGGLCPGVSVHGVSVWGVIPTETPPYGNMRAVSILLKCILVSEIFCTKLHEILKIDPRGSTRNTRFWVFFP